MYRQPPASAKPPKAMGGHPQPHLNLAPPKPAPKARPQHATAQIQHHVDHFAEAPAQHAKALKRLGVNRQTIHHIAQEARGTNPRVAGGRAPVKQSSGFANIHNFTGSKWVDRQLGDLSNMALYAIPGTVVAAQHPERAAKQMYHQLGQDIHHPLRHPVYTAADLWAASGMVGGAAARVGGVGRALAEGEGVGRAALHAPEPGTHTLRSGDLTVEKPLSRNAPRRQFQKARYGRMQRELDRKAGSVQAAPTTRPGKFMEKHGPESFVGNRIRTEKRLNQSFEMGSAEHARRLSKKFSAGEEAAQSVINIEGKRALRLPEETIARHIATHERYIAEGFDKAGNEARIRELRSALPVLKAKDPKFVAASDALVAMSRRAQGEHIGRGLLHPRTAESHLANVAAEYGSPEARTAPSIARAAAKTRAADRPSKAVAKAQARVNRLEKLSVRSEAKEFNIARVPPHLGGYGPGPGTTRLKAALSVAKDDLQRVTKAYQTRQANTRVALAHAKGTEPKAPEGSAYFHLGHGLERGGTGAYVPRRYETGIGPPTVPARHQWKAFGLRRGYVPAKTSQAMLKDYARKTRIHSSVDTFQALRDASVASKESVDHIPVRTDRKITDELRKYVQAIERNPQATDEQLAAMTGVNRERLKNEIAASDVAGTAKDRIGSKLPGIRWVDQRYIKEIGGRSGAGGGLMQVADAITNPMRVGQLYLQPKYLLNALGNASMLAPEGMAGPHSLWRAARYDKIMGPERTAIADSMMGSGKALGQAVSTGKFHRSAEGLANFWNAVTDMHMRRASLDMQLRRAGVKTPEQFDRLMADPKKRNEVVERARAPIGDYENLTPVEKDYVRRLIYFYPWLKVATKWTGHVVGEHPVKTAVLAQAGRPEAAHVKRVLGLLPQWARLSGLVPVGKKAGGIVKTINPSSVNTPATLVQTGAAIPNTVRGVVGLKKRGTAGLQDVATPALGTLLTAGGQDSSTANRRTGILGQLQQLPYVAAARRAGAFSGPSKTYPAKGIGPALEPLAGGGLVPRPTSVTQLNKAGEKELRAGMSAPQRVQHDFEKFKTQSNAVLKKHGVVMPKFYAERLNLWNERMTARAHAGKDWSAKVAADLDVIHAHGWIDTEQLKAAKANIARVPKAKRSVVARQLNADYFDRGGMLHQGAKEMGLKLPQG